MIKQIVVCDCCGKELKSNSERYHIDFDSLRYCDAAGDMDYNNIRVELCESCCKKAVESLCKIADTPTQEFSKDKDTRPNPVLTKEDLEKIHDVDDCPIWVKDEGIIWPAILDYYDGELVAVWAACSDNYLRISNYGKTWWAYRYKPEGKMI